MPGSSPARTTHSDASPASRKLFGAGRQRTIVLNLLLLATTLLVYQPVVRNQFVNFDDDRYITENSHVRAGLNGTTLKWAFTTFEFSNWHPLTWLSHTLDFQLFQLNPAGHHYENVLLHALNALLLFWLLRRATGSLWASLMVAALFALHPVNVETVAWASERKNVLSMFFFLLGLQAYTAYARRPAVGRYLAVAGLFALGLMAKPQIITFPFVLLLWDYWPLGRIAGRVLPASPSHDSAQIEDSAQNGNPAPSRPLVWLVLEKIPLLVLAAISAVLTVRAQAAGGALHPVNGVLQSAIGYSPATRFANAVVAYVRYLGKAAWPSDLAVLYPHPGTGLPLWQVVVSAILLLIITAFAVRARRQPYLAVGWFWFLGTLVPMIGLVQVGSQAMADRYAYLPFIGLFLMATWAATGAVKTGLAKKKKVPGLRLNAWLAVPAIAVLIAFSAVTYRQIGYWHDSETLWTHALAVTENNFVAHDKLADLLISQGRVEEAFQHYQAAVEIFPADVPANLNIGVYYHAQGNLRRAREQYQKVLNFAGDASMRADAYSNLGSLYRQTKDYDRARENFQAALKLDPDKPIALMGVGLMARKNGDFNQAISQYLHALAVQPTDVGYLLLEEALRQSGRPGAADAARENAQRLSANIEQAQQTAEHLLAF